MAIFNGGQRSISFVNRHVDVLIMVLTDDLLPIAIVVRSIIYGARDVLAILEMTDVVKLA